MATFYNQATLSYNGNTAVSNITAGEIRSSLKLTKTAVKSTYSDGEGVVYVLSITNTSASAVENLTLTDDLGRYTYNDETLYPLDYTGAVRYYINGALQSAPGAITTSPLSFNSISVPAMGNTVIVYEARINEFAPLDIEGTITNTATLTGDSLAQSVSASYTINPAAEVNLSVRKSLSPMVISSGEALTYTFVIENRGNLALTAADSGVFTDTFTPPLKNISVTYNSTQWSEGVNYTYDEDTGVFTSLAGQISVDAAAYSRTDVGAVATTAGESTLTITGTI